MLSLNGVTIAFGGLIAVDRLTMTVHENSVTALIGPNGAGKTTAFNLISGVYTLPSRGKSSSPAMPYRDSSLTR